MTTTTIRKQLDGGHMHHTKIVSAGMAALLFLAALTGVAFAAPLAFDPTVCSGVNVEVTINGYDVMASGWGRYARIQDLTAAQTVVATDFGPGATAYTWTGLSLDTSHQYQVQVSSTGLTYTSENCLFTPPPPQSVIIERFEIVRGAFEWDATEDGLGYWVEYNSRPVTAWTPAQSPGNWGWFSYRVLPLPTSSRNFPFGTYWLMAQDLSGAAGYAAMYVHQPKEVEPGK